MNKEIHYIPVGFDFERLVQPLHQDNFSPDRVVLFQSEKRPANEREAEISENIVKDLSSSMESVLDIEVEIETLRDIYDYIDIYKSSYQKISDELNRGNQIYVNISSMPRTVTFAFATAVDTLILENPDARNDLHTYYVSPEKYLITEVREELEDTVELLRNVNFSSEEEEKVTAHLGTITDTLQKLEKGTTAGTKEMEDGKHHVEFVAPPIVDLNDSEEELLNILSEQGEVESISELSRLHAESNREAHDRSANSAAQYRVDNLEEKGLINRTEGEGGGHKISLSRIGMMWASTQ